MELWDIFFVLLQHLVGGYIFTFKYIYTSIGRCLVCDYKNITPDNYHKYYRALHDFVFCKTSLKPRIKVK